MSAGKRFGSAAVATTGARTSALGLRAAIARVHRYAGLATALFLFVAGLSGAVISWDHDPATGRLFEPGYNQVFVDPVTGETIGRREWEKVALDREHLLSFLYKLHYSLHIPESAASTGCASIIQATITAAAAWG